MVDPIYNEWDKIRVFTARVEAEKLINNQDYSEGQWFVLCMNEKFITVRADLETVKKVVQIWKECGLEAESILWLRRHKPSIVGRITEFLFKPKYIHWDRLYLLPANKAITLEQWIAIQEKKGH